MRWQISSLFMALLVAGCSDDIDRCAQAEPGVICAVAGTGRRAFNGDGLPADETDLYLVSAAAMSPAGDLYIVDFNNQRIRTVAEDGTMTTVVGSGVHYFAATGGPAIESPLENPMDLAFDAAGQLVFVSMHDPRVLYVDGEGMLWSMAGTGIMGDSGDGGPALLAEFNELAGVAIAPEGSVYVSDAGAHRVRVIDPGGMIRTVAGTGVPGYAGDGGLATSAQLNHPSALAVDSEGRLYIADSRNHAVRQIDENGVITTMAGTGQAGFSGDDGPATSAQLDGPEGLVFMADGSLLIADWQNHRIRRIDPDGIISTLAGTGQEGLSGNGGPAIDAALAGPARLSMNSGVLYIADQLNSCVRSMRLP